jgi:hypothetical protein
MKITTLSEQQRRADARGTASAPTARTVNTWTAAARHEPRPPLTAKVWVSRGTPQEEIPASDALRAAEDEGWPPASGR